MFIADCVRLSQTHTHTSNVNAAIKIGRNSIQANHPIEDTPPQLTRSKRAHERVCSVFDCF